MSTNLDGSVARIIDWGWQLPAAGLYSTINDLNQVHLFLLLTALNSVVFALHLIPISFRVKKTLANNTWND